MQKGKRQEVAIQSVGRSLEILEYVIRHPTGCTVNEVAKEFQLHVSTASRILSSLRAYDFVRKDQEKGYYLGGYKILELSALIQKQTKLQEIALPLMRQLATDIGETVNLVVREGNQVVFIESIIGSSFSIVTTSSRVGQTMPMHSTAAGKILLSAMEEPCIVIRPSTLTKFTPNTMTTTEALKIELENVRRQGYALDNEEHEVGLRCLAAPIMDHRGKTIASISLSGPTVRITIEKLEEIIPILLETASQISKQLGFSKEHF